MIKHNALPVKYYGIKVFTTIELQKDIISVSNKIKYICNGNIIFLWNFGT